MTTLEIPKALHRGEEELPFVALGDGTHLQLLQVDVEAGLWVIRTKFEAGRDRADAQAHRRGVRVHDLGVVEVPRVPGREHRGLVPLRAGRIVHTLTVPADNDGMTDVWFAIYGANLNLDADGNVESVIDAGLVRDSYFALCEANGLGRPPVLGA